ncbi:unnamed protein product [Enterobius vermicularis]|uniref:Response regulatory domain-containing protein n=1 Tax=Enterobius vermicularis TaxID=51028 RepID=A0A0N4V8M3_ENTVE|nr:unnamed protein product [Enterobius vermicularis]
MCAPKHCPTDTPPQRSFVENVTVQQSSTVTQIITVGLPTASFLYFLQYIIRYLSKYGRPRSGNKQSSIPLVLVTNADTLLGTKAVKKFVELQTLTFAICNTNEGMAELKKTLKNSECEMRHVIFKRLDMTNDSDVKKTAEQLLCEIYCLDLIVNIPKLIATLESKDITAKTESGNLKLIETLLPLTENAGKATILIGTYETISAEELAGRYQTVEDAQTVPNFEFLLQQLSFR